MTAITNKPDDLHTEVVTINDQVAIRLGTAEAHRNISLDLAVYLIKELTDRVAEANELMQKRAAVRSAHEVEATDEPSQKYRRIGESYSILKWHRESAGSYVASGAKGIKLKVYSEGKGRWFAQVGNDVINPTKPLPMKVLAVEAVENVLVG